MAASCLCSACPTCRGSTSAKIMYSLFLLIGALVSMVMCSNGVEEKLRKIPFLCNGTKDNAEPSLVDDSIIGDIVPNVMPDGYLDCNRLVGFEAVYRVCFGLTCFYWLFMVLMIRVRNTRDPRAAIQNGFWGLKALIMVAFVVAAFFIPSDPFVTVWYWFGLFAGMAFILVQLILYIDFAFNTNEQWVGNMEDAGDERDRKCWFSLLFGSTFVIYALCAVGIGFMYYYYAGYYTATTSDCGLHKFFISFNMLLCMLMTVVSILPKIQEANPSAGLLQSAVISAYVLYLTWSAMASNPEKECNPSIVKILNGTDTNETTQPTMITGYDSQSIFGLIIFFIAVLYSSIRSGSQGDRMGLGGESVAMTEPSEPIDAGESGHGQKVWDDEEDQVNYNYSWAHFQFSLATLYIMMTLTYWFNIGQVSEDGQLAIAGFAPVWIKIVSSWFCVILYLWVLVAPAVLTDREFHF